MGQKNRKRYQRRLDIGSLVALMLLGAACAAVACGFVRVKNAHVECVDNKRSLEQEIHSLERELESVSTRIDTAFDRPSLAAVIAGHGSQLEPILDSDTLSGVPAGPPAALAAAASDGGMTYINVDNPSG